MNRDERAEHYDGNAKQYLEDTEGSYVRNADTGLYEPKSDQTHGYSRNNPTKQVGSDRPKPNWSEVATAIVASIGLFISVLTLVGLAFTVYFTAKQWGEANRNAVAAERSADYARESVSKTQSAINQSRDQFAKDQRPYLWIDDSGSHQISIGVDQGAGTNNGKAIIEFWVKNFGKTPAIRVHSSAYISTAGDLENDIQWNKRSSDFAGSGGGIYPPGGSFSKDARSTEVVGPFFLRPNPGADPALPNIAAMHARVEYFDQNGRRYVSEICFLLQANRFPKRCNQHNNLE